MPTWDSTFRTALASEGLSGLYVALVFGPTYSPNTGGPAQGADIIVGNYVASGVWNCLGPSCAVSGASLDVFQWSTTADQLTADLTGEDANACMRALLDAGVHRGTFLEVRVTLPGEDPATEYKRVWIGRVQQIQSAATFGSAGAWKVVGWGVQSLLQARRQGFADATEMLDSLLGEWQLFSDVRNLATPIETEFAVLSGYTVGDASITVTSTAGFVNESGQDGVIKLTRADTGAFFYLRYTGRTGTTFTGLSSSGRFGTTAFNVDATTHLPVTTIQHVHFIYGPPLDVLRKILTSTGTGTNGAYDTMPNAWGLLLSDDLVDLTDIGLWAAELTASYSVQFLIEEPIANPWQWLSGWLSKLGIAIVLYEGRISVRIAQDQEEASPKRADFAFVPGSIASLSWALCDQRVSSEYVAVLPTSWPTRIPGLPTWREGLTDENSIAYLVLDLTLTPGGTLAWETRVSHPRTVPYGRALIVDLSEMSPDYDATHTYEDDPAWHGDVQQRRYHYVCNIAERVEINVPHRGCASLAPGDLTRLTSALVFGVPEAASATDTYSLVDVTVVDGPAVDWLRPQLCRVAVLRHKAERWEFTE